MRKNKIRVLILLVGGALFFGKCVDAAQNEGTVTSGSYYDSTILESGSGSHSKKGSKRSSKRRHHKAKKEGATIIQNPGEPQEDVTDQKEVSDQADQPARKK